MRKSRYGPERCDTCEQVITWTDQRYLKANGAKTSIHLGCLSPTDQRRVLYAHNMRCLFCGRGSMTSADLIDHFAQHHGRVVINW